MVGEGRGFAALVERQNPAIEITLCCIHREALMVKVLPTELSETMNDCISAVNFIKARALNSRIFSLLCEEMESQHQSLLFCTAVRWLSRGKVLARLFELRHEISQFLLSQNSHDLYALFESDRWIAKLAYLANIFEHLNELNIKMQGGVAKGVARKKLRRVSNFAPFNVTSFTSNDILPFVNYARRYYKNCCTKLRKCECDFTDLM